MDNQVNPQLARLYADLAKALDRYEQTTGFIDARLVIHHIEHDGGRHEGLIVCSSTAAEAQRIIDREFLARSLNAHQH